MKKIWTVLFVIYNVIALSIEFAGVGIIPHTLIFGWWPSQHFFFTLAIVVNSIVWGLYFSKYLNIHSHLDEKYKDA